jgi:putative membrane protein
MQWTSIILLALIALFAFACKKSENQVADTGTTTVVTSTTDTSATTTTTGTTAASLSDKDKEFVTKASQGGMAEVSLGQMAAAKANNNDVKEFGNRMVTDHSKANDELKQLAANKGITLPTEPGADEKKTEDALSTKSGKAFDKAYMTDMVKDHEKDVAEFQKESKDAQDPELKAWVTRTLPTLQDHLKMAKQVASKVK